MPSLSGSEGGVALPGGNGILHGAYTRAAHRFDVLAEDWLIMRALILRSLRVRHTGNPLGIFVEIFRPLAICTAHYFYFSLMQRDVPGNEGAKYPAGSHNIPGITRMHLRVAGALWAFILYLFFAYAVVYPLQLLGQPVKAPELGLSLIDYGLAASLGFGYGLVCAAIGEVVSALKPVIKLLEWAVFISSGVYDSLLTIPVPVAKYIQYNPLIDLAEYQRRAYYAGYPIFMVTLTYPAIWAAGLVFSGLAINRALNRRR